jgi:myo-inositol 2-dehydrogenase / D-chiro-inositol 1-dehydrogenase
MDTKKLREIISVGIIGTGGMGTRHAANLHRFVGGARVAAVYDLDPEHAVRAAELGGGARVFSDPVQLIQDPSVDAVLIASPDDTHTDMTLACLHAGKPVLCEKPLATSAEDARKVLNAETSLGRKLISVGFMRRFDPQHAAVKAAVMSGDLGKPLLWKGVHRNASVPFGITSATILTNSAGHDIDSARFLLGEEVREVYVRGLKSRPELHADTQDLLLIELFMTNNTMGTAEVYVNAEYGYEVSAELICQRGTVVTQQPDKAMVRAKAHRGFYVSSDWLSPFQEAYVAEEIDWIQSLQTGQPFHGASAWDGYVAMLVITACIQSLNTNAVVPVSLIEKPALYR